MDKIIDLVLRTPLAKRYVAGFAERGIIIVLGALAGWIGLPEADITKDVAGFAAEVAPYVAGAIMLVIAQKRMKKAEVTIETSRVLPSDTPRPLVDATVRTLLKTGASVPAPPKYVAGVALNQAARAEDLLQRVPPGTVDRTD